MAEFPSASTTGVRAGVSLTPVNGQISTTHDGQVIEGISVDTLVVDHDGVTIRDCRIGKLIVGNAQSNVVNNTTIEYTDIYGSNGLNSVDIAGNDTVIRFSDISGSENGIWLEADGVVIENNYIHNLFSNTGASDPHIDGIQIPGSNIGAIPTENIIIRGNNIDLDNRTASASITMMDGINVDIIGNRLSGGSSVIYFEGNSRGSDVINNVFDEYAFFYVEGASWRDQNYSGNIDEDTRALLPITGNGSSPPTPTPDPDPAPDPDPTPTLGSLSINDVIISEGDSGTKVATFAVTRSGSTAAFDVNFATANATATVSDSDFVATSNTLHFGANENTRTVSVTINGDTKVEANETFNVVLSNATSGVSITDGQGVGTITNDDGVPTTNLVANGGFETGDFDGWTLGGNSSGIYIAPTAYPGGVHSGSYSAGLGSMNRTDGSLAQSIATTAGQHYTLSFWIESDNDGNAPVNHFSAKWNGQPLLTQTDAPNSGYQLYTFDVVGVEGSSLLQFDAYNHPDAWRLDDVTLTAAGVAAPATFTSGADVVTLPLVGGTFNALGGNDKLVYTGGPVSIDGGRGVDTVDFSQFSSAVWVNLSSTGPEIRTQDRPDLSSDNWRAIGDLTKVENLVGSAYSDFLKGHDGNNTLIGGDGADTFAFDHLGSNSQHDVIVDFRPGVDRIDLAATPVTGFGDLLTFGNRYMEQVGKDVLIHTSVNQDTSILLQDVQLGSLTQSDFLF